ncbi:MAG: hypothetical protein L6R42_002375, partial [Xanthoria sp. 1 TBL-2021]
MPSTASCPVWPVACKAVDLSRVNDGLPNPHGLHLKFIEQSSSRSQAVLYPPRTHVLSHASYLSSLLPFKAHHYVWLIEPPHIATGTPGKAMFAGEFASMTALHSSIPKHIPRPLSWGAFATGDRYFQLYTFHHFVKGRRPSISSLASVAVSLHSAPSSLSPTGKFGFEITTYNGNLPQDNTWTETWEEFYNNGMRRMMDLDAKARGESKDMKGLEGDFLEKVVPRLLRPLENTKKGRSIKPVLLHGDLWVGNASVEGKEGANEEGNCMLFDSSAFYWHNG